MAQLEVKNLQGKAVGKVDVVDAIAKAEPSSALLHRAVVAEEANSRQGTQSAKTRSEVRGGGRKPYRQKKTGNARQGSIRSPHYRHGGMALAVKPRDYDKKVNKKERRAAILGAFAAHLTAGNVVAVDKIAFDAPKTKSAQEFLAALGLSDIRRILVVLPQYDEIAYKSFRNLPNVVVRTAPSVGETPDKSVTFSTRDVLIAHKIVVAQDALAKMQEAWTK